MLPFATARLRHGVGKTEGDELNKTGEIAVRQITTLVPPQETEGLLLIREWMRPTILVRHGLAEVFAFGSRRHALERRSPDRHAVLTSLRADQEIGAPISSLCQQLPQHERQNAAVLVVIDFNRRIDAATDGHVFHLAIFTCNLQREVLLRFQR